MSFKAVAKPSMGSSLENKYLDEWIQSKPYLFIACFFCSNFDVDSCIPIRKSWGSVPSAGSWLTVYVQVWGFSLICRAHQGGVRPRLVQVDIVHLQTDVVLSLQTGQDVLDFFDQATETWSAFRLWVPTSQHDGITVEWTNECIKTEQLCDVITMCDTHGMHVGFLQCVGAKLRLEKPTPL